MLLGIAIWKSEKPFAEFFSVKHDLEPLFESIQKKHQGIYTIELEAFRIDGCINLDHSSIFLVTKNNFSFQRSIALIEELQPQLHNKADYLDYFCENILRKYNDSSPLTKIETLSNKLCEIEEIYLNDLELIEERGFKINDILIKTNALKRSSMNYFSKAKKLKNNLESKPFYKKKRFWIVVCVLVFILFFAALFFLWKL